MHYYNLIILTKKTYLDEILKNRFDDVKGDSGLCHEVSGEDVGDGQETVADRQRLVKHGVGPGIKLSEQ